MVPRAIRLILRLRPRQALVAPAGKPAGAERPGAVAKLVVVAELVVEQAAGGVTQNPTQRHSTMANLACYPAINIPNGFAENGQPTNVTFFARPFRETELLALAVAYQEASGFYRQKPTKLD